MKEGIRFEVANIRLACGCNVRRRDIPRSDRQTFLCESNLGHGYKGQPWMSWDYGGRSNTNPLYREGDSK